MKFPKRTAGTEGAVQKRPENPEIQTAPDIPRGAYTPQSIDQPGGHAPGLSTRERTDLKADISHVQQMMDVELDPSGELYQGMRALIKKLEGMLVK